MRNIAVHIVIHSSKNQPLKMKLLSSIAVILTLLLAKPMSAQSLQISNIQWPQFSYTMCTQSDVYVNLIRSCYNSTYTGATYTVVGFNIVVDVNYTVTGSCNTILDFPGHQISLGLLPAGSYAVTVKANMNAATQSTMTSSLVVSQGSCCPFVANAGNDSMVCSLDSFQLNGNIPPSYSAGKWTVTSGSGIIVADTVPNAWATFLSTGNNIFTWITVDSVCTTFDSVIISNIELPSDAVTELDKPSCFDTIAIHATPPTVGKGKWTSNTSGTYIFNNTSSSAKALNMSIGANELIWTVSNKICPKSIDTLMIEYSQVVDSPMVSVSGTILTSNVQPSYQWYNGQNAISGETNQSYTAVANGSYSVYSVAQNCPNGLFSEEIEITTIGINQISKTEIVIYPNPSDGLIYIKNIEPNTKVLLLDLFGRVVLEEKTVQNKIVLDLTSFNAGLYQLLLINSNETLVREIVLH